MTYTLKIGSTDISSYVKSYTVSYEQMFANAGRNMAGVLKATYVGTTPKLMLELRSLTGAEMKTLMGLVNQASFSVTWWDNDSATYKTGNFYRGDFQPKMIMKSPIRYEAMNLNLIGYGVL